MEITKYLVENGADIHIQDDEGKTPLHTAAQHNQTEIVTLLKEK